MIAALLTAAAAVVAAAPLSTSRRFTSIILSSRNACPAPRETGRAQGLREDEHRDPVKNRRGQRIPERSAAKPHPEYENETRADHSDEEAVAARRREPENAETRRLRPKNREQRQNDQHRRDECEEQSRLPGPRHPIEHGRPPYTRARAKPLAMWLRTNQKADARIIISDVTAAESSAQSM